MAVLSDRKTIRCWSSSIIWAHDTAQCNSGISNVSMDIAVHITLYNDSSIIYADVNIILKTAHGHLSNRQNQKLVTDSPPLGTDMLIIIMRLSLVGYYTFLDV